MNAPAWTLFDRVADDYDEVAPFFTEYGRAIVAAIDPPPGCRFLDLGAGRGALTGPALARGCAVTAVDAAPAMVKRLAAEHPRAVTHVMDAQALTFPADSFDVVASAFVIHLLDDPAAGVAEAHRVLAPGGRLAFTGGRARNVAPSAAARPTLGGRLDALFLEFTPRLLPGGGMGRPIDPAELLERAGFVDVHGTDVEVAIPLPDNETLWRWAMSHGYRAFIEGLPDTHREEFHRRLLALPADDRTLHRVSGLWSGRKP
jgi:SAM-dependent methyltransferase